MITYLLIQHPLLSLQLVNMDILDRYFPDSYEREKLHVQLPPDISIFEILRNHRLLLQNVWVPLKPRVISSTPVKTAFTWEESIFLAITRREITITSHDDGLSILEDLVVREQRFSHLICWRVIESVAEDRAHCLSTAMEGPSQLETPENYLLEEAVTAMGDRLLCFLTGFESVDYHHTTKKLMKFLD